MAYITDSTQTFTITLTALLEGLGIITHIGVYNETSGINYIWTLATGWDASPEAIEGDTIAVAAKISNQGSVADYLWAEFSSAQVSVSPALQESVNPIDVGGLPHVFTWRFTMPPTNVSITINAGHVE